MISVCIATYNANKHIREQIDSILPQLSINDEIIVADDASVDETLEILNSIKDDRVKIISTNKNLGVVKNFEQALYAAKGEYIFLCDQDDVWLPTKVTECIAFLEGKLLVVTDCVVVDSELNYLYPSYFDLRKSKEGFFYNLYKNSYIGCCIAFRRELLIYALPIPKSVPMHDAWLGMLASVIGDVGFLQKQLLLYRRHSCNVSALKSQYGVFKKIHFRVSLISNIFCRLSIIYLRRLLIRIRFYRE